MKDMIGYVLLAAALVAALGGIHVTSGGDYEGLLGIAGGIACAVLSYRMMSGAPSSRPARPTAAPEGAATTEPAAVPERVAEEV